MLCIQLLSFDSPFLNHTNKNYGLIHSMSACWVLYTNQCGEIVFPTCGDGYVPLKDACAWKVHHGHTRSLDHCMKPVDFVIGLLTEIFLLFSAWANTQNDSPLFEIAYSGRETEIVVSVPG